MDKEKIEQWLLTDPEYCDHCIKMLTEIKEAILSKKLDRYHGKMATKANLPSCAFPPAVLFNEDAIPKIDEAISVLESLKNTPCPEEEEVSHNDNGRTL